MADPVLADLAAEVRSLAASPEHLARRRLWAGLHALQPPRALVSYAMYTHVWEREVAPADCFRHVAGLARAIEVQLRARLWKAASIPDDEPVLPTVWLYAPHPPGDERLWGVPLVFRRSGAHGAYKPVPPLRDEGDLARLHAPPYEEDTAARRALEEQAAELLGDTLPIKLHTDELHFGPFEWAVRMRGMDALLFDVVDRPSFVHALMDRITQGMEAYHRARETAGGVDAEASFGFHMYWDDMAGNRLRDSWAYVHAQSAASLSPRMYAEFIQPYNARVAGLFGKVYYHGCEDLSAKVRVIRDLPNLRLFHVGPWTPVQPVVDCLGAGFALEVHSHPERVLGSADLADVQRDLIDRHRAAAGVPHVLKLCDVETVEGRPERLRQWADLARVAVG